MLDSISVSPIFTGTSGELCVNGVDLLLFGFVTFAPGTCSLIVISF